MVVEVVVRACRCIRYDSCPSPLACLASVDWCLESLSGNNSRPSQSM